MFQVDTSHPTPLYHQLERSIRFAIAIGKLGIGDQLPTVRQLAVDLRINANTVAKVYTELERTGVVETRRGVGTFVSARPNEAANRRGRVSRAGAARCVRDVNDAESCRRDYRCSARIVSGPIAQDRPSMGTRGGASPR